jgi:hypothetical protein
MPLGGTAAAVADLALPVRAMSLIGAYLERIRYGLIVL